MAKCENCVSCIYDGECYDTGHKAYDAWYCEKRTDVEDKDTFPFKSTSCKQFKMDFWKSEFAQEVDGSDESLAIAMKKWEEKYNIVSA